VLIRCQRCRALYSLSDGVAPAGARFKVECGRCLLVFETAAPTRRAAEGVQGTGSPVGTTVPQREKDSSPEA
jgi:predicted Zn finger-like uncharacterized protein